MTIFRALFIVIIVLITNTEVTSCSCDRIYFCEYIKKEEPITVIRGVAIASKTYSEDNEAVYIKVLDVLRDDFGITDTIKVYGKEITADCSVDVISGFPIGLEFYLAFGYEGEPYSNPDSLSETYYQNRLLLCQTIFLWKTDSKYIGKISENMLSEDLSFVQEYPADSFEEKLADCSFDIEEIIQHNCTESDFVVYPNPLQGSKLKIRNLYKGNLVDDISLFTIDGRLISKSLPTDFFYSFNLKYLEIDLAVPRGIYVLIITCRSRRVVHKIVVQ